jgi:hypothetical protein
MKILVVYHEHTLGYVDSSRKNVVSIIKASPLRGASGDHHKVEEFYISESEIRRASKYDFMSYNVDESQYSEKYGFEPLK